jgi:hypothetical protein
MPIVTEVGRYIRKDNCEAVYVVHQNVGAHSAFDTQIGKDGAEDSLRIHNE